MKIIKEDTIIIGPIDIIEKLTGVKNKIYSIAPGEELSFPGIKVKGVPAYNLNKSFHKKEFNWLGYYLEFDDKKYYIAGDTDALDENKNLDVDIAFIPIGGTYTMDYSEAAAFVNELKPKEVIPIHYGMVVGSKEDFLYFKDLVKYSKVSEYIKL
jgi:L-ascorbate metabolism protein UlaG (beta-lactamase superfamily)